MSELHKPAPGPWFEDEDSIAWLQLSGLDVPEQSVEAIMDLPAWIEAHDAWKARAEKAEAEVARLWEVSTELGERAQKAEGRLEAAQYVISEYESADPDRAREIALRQRAEKAEALVEKLTPWAREGGWS